MQEIVRLKHSVSLLETYIVANHRPGATSLPPHLKRTLDNPSNPISPKKESIDGDTSDKDNPPGMLGSHGHHGFYAGPTAAVTHLAVVFPLSHYPSFVCSLPLSRTTPAGTLQKVTDIQARMTPPQTSSWPLSNTTRTSSISSPLFQPSTNW